MLSEYGSNYLIIVSSLVCREKNEVELTGIEEKLAEAITNAGDTEVLDVMIVKAKALSRMGNWSDALKAFDAILVKEKTSTGKKIDATMEKAKIALFNMVFVLFSLSFFSLSWYYLIVHCCMRRIPPF